MSKDRLGPIVRALVGIDSQYHGVLADIVNRFNSSDAPAWNGLFKKALEQGLPSEGPKEEPGKQPPFLSVIATTKLAAIAGKKTKQCFTGDRWYHCDSDFDGWLPKDQPDAAASDIATLAFAKEWTFAEAATKILGLGAGTSIQLLGKALIENGHTMTLAQAEELVEAIERGEQTGLRIDGWGNFFFVETGNEDNPVSVGGVHRDVRDWDANVDRLGRGYRWSADDCLLVRNLDASKL